MLCGKKFEDGVQLYLFFYCVSLLFRYLFFEKAFNKMDKIKVEIENIVKQLSRLQNNIDSILLAKQRDEEVKRQR